MFSRTQVMSGRLPETFGRLHAWRTAPSVLEY